MSSFMLDLVQLWQHQRSREEGQEGVVVEDDTGGGRGAWMGVLYLLTTLLGGLGLVWLGREGVRWWQRKQEGAVRAAAGREAEEEVEEQQRVEQGGSVDAPEADHARLTPSRAARRGGERGTCSRVGAAAGAKAAGAG